MHLLTSERRIGICSGKQSVANFLITRHGFRELQYRESGAPKECPASTVAEATEAPDIFYDTDDLLDFVTRKWREKWIIVDLRHENLLEYLSRRPFFLLVSLEAPMTLRWTRFQNKWGQSRPRTLKEPGLECWISPILENDPTKLFDV